MTSPAATTAFDRYAQIGDLALRVRSLIDRIWLPIIVVLGGEVAVLVLSDNPAATCFGAIVLGTLFIFGVWRRAGIGLPLVPVVAVQHLIAYGLPIVIGNESVIHSPEVEVTESGLEVLVFSVALIATWSVAMRIILPARPESYAMPDFQQEGSDRLNRLGLGLIIAGTAYQVLDQANLLDFLFALLPSGSNSLVGPLVTGASACGFFLTALFVGSGDIKRPQRIMFWTLLIVSAGLSASGFLLSAATTMVAAVLIGLFWSTGKIPWRYVTIVVAVLSFLSVGKFTMRSRYWQFGEDKPVASFSFIQIPAIYLEWSEASIEALKPPAEITTLDANKKADDESRQTLLERINNLQNLLYVIHAVQDWNIPPLGGDTYSLIPPLLVPRIMWKDKPRSHEGQVLLNVHFGRQDIGSTFKTYVAWGLLPEAYGNFGPYLGSVYLGIFMGAFFAWLENITARKLLLSLEGFVSFVVLLGFANSFEMVASVLVTMIFQSVIPIIFCSLPFLRRMTVRRPEPPAA